MRFLLLALTLLLSACPQQALPANEHAFQAWLSASPARASSFARFEEMLRREGVSDVVLNRELWLTDRLEPECAVEAFTAPPEDHWLSIVPALRFIRDQVEPAVGEVTVASGYRDEAFNACVGGASRSAHRGYYALDLLPLDRAVTREQLIEVLCPLHVREGQRLNIGLGIYHARRFHVDARGFRGWGADFSRATFPCDADA